MTHSIVVYECAHFDVCCKFTLSIASATRIISHGASVEMLLGRRLCVFVVDTAAYVKYFFGIFAVCFIGIIATY